MQAKIERLEAEINRALRAHPPFADALVLLATIPGVGPGVARTILAEVGADMSRFPTAGHLVSWAGRLDELMPDRWGRAQASRRHRPHPRRPRAARTSPRRARSDPPPRAPEQLLGRRQLRPAHLLGHERLQGRPPPLAALLDPLAIPLVGHRTAAGVPPAGHPRPLRPARRCYTPESPVGGGLKSLVAAGAL